MRGLIRHAERSLLDDFGTRTIDVRIKGGAIAQWPALTYREFGIVEPREGFFLVQHIPTGVALPFCFFNQEKAAEFVVETDRLRNEWMTARGPEFARSFAKITELAKARGAVDCRSGPGGETVVDAEPSLNGYGGAI